MKAARRMRAGLILAAAATMLSACGNTPGSGGAQLLQRLPGLFSNRTGQAVVTPQLIAQGLSATDKPVQMYEIESRKTQFLMLEIERNGPYQTFGSTTRQMIAMRRGMITSTRGFGGDLMSSDVDNLLAQVSRRAPATVQYDMRFLTPENLTEVQRYACTLRLDGTRAVQSGEVNSSGTVVRAECNGVGRPDSFTNSYVVASDGYILSTRQWLGDTLGYVKAQALRR